MQTTKSKTASKTSVSPASNKQDRRLQGVTLDKDLYMDLLKLTSFNKVMLIEPDTDSGIFVQALDELMNYVQPDMESVLRLDEPTEDYIKRLNSLPSGSIGDTFTKKNFWLNSDYDANIKRLAGYNKHYELPLSKGSADIHRVALRYYLQNLDYDFRK